MPTAATPLRHRLANNIKHLLARGGRSGNKVAAASGIDGKSITNLVDTTFDPRLTTMAKAAKGLGVPLWELLAIDLTGDPASDEDVLRLLELFAQAKPEGREAIMKVALAMPSSD